MSTYALTSRLDGSRSLLNLTTGERVTFHGDDGPLLAGMFDGEWPECEHCEDRSCVECDRCGAFGCDLCDCPDDDDDQEDD